MHGTRKTARDAAIKRIGFLKSAKQVNVHPSEWIMSKVPVLPPIFRPVTTMSTSKMPLVADPNYMYRDLIEANENLQQLSGKVDDTSEERLALYNTFKALTGLGDPIKPQTQKDKVKGILKHIIGSSPKFGSMQRKLLGSTVDLVGRATIIPNPALDMDQIGIPIEEAWTMYKPFIVRRLVRQGMKHVQALDEVEKRSAVSEKAMLAEMDDRPIMANRAPVLHRYGIMAFKPVPVKGKTLQMPLLVYSGFGADNDGDAMQFHVIHDDSAAKEALDKMLPSRNLISPANFKVHQLPVQEYVAGLHAMTAGESNTPVRTFRSKADAIAAYRRGEINLDQRVQIHDD
jgi:DNA-directed RNA polymerase subunit beta'